jgi:hypothetical protein
VGVNTFRGGTRERKKNQPADPPFTRFWELFEGRLFFVSIKAVLPEPFSPVRKKKFETLTFDVAAKESLTFVKISSSIVFWRTVK